MAWQTGGDAARIAARRSGVHHSPMLHWLISLGGVGLFLVAIVDSSVIPLPIPGSTDLLLLLLTVQRGTTVLSAVVYGASALAGSMVGGYLTWSAGRKGGEVTLERYVPQRFLRRIHGWVEKHGSWSVAISAILPPPVPLTPFLLAAGALQVPRNQFLIAYGCARTVRYGLLAWLGFSFGRHFVHLWQHKLDEWSTTILWIYGALLLLGIGFALWKMRRGRAARQQAGVAA